jgi:LPXTG-motif cell wall-anchored protein
MKSVRGIILALGILSFVTLCCADTLLNKKTGRVVSIGLAKIEKEIIHWSSCNSKAPSKDYSVLRYTVIPGNNCIAPMALPKTGSSLPLIGALGLLFVIVSLVMRLCRRVFLHSAFPPGA